jgi:CheY-like chemotaxis protein
MLTAMPDDTKMVPREGQAMALRDGPRVLLIDDDRWVRALFTDVLTAMGCEVEAVATGEEGLARFARGKYELVITDLEVGGVGGLEVARTVKTGASRVPVIIMSGSPGGLDGLDRHLKSCTVLAKPVRLPDFQDAVLRALDD